MKKNVLIAIQARSNSTRFPKKIYEKIGKRRVLDHVIDQANSSSWWLNAHSKNKMITSMVAVLHPHDDKELVDTFSSSQCQFISGPEHDVLERYLNAWRLTQADYVVRITSDCPLILDFIITKHVNVAVLNGHDYVNNIDESCRTVADGFDCEVMSSKAMRWLDVNAKHPTDREHVTTSIRRLRPKELDCALILSRLDTSKMKMSVDTVEDLELMRKYYHQKEHNSSEASRIYGGSVYEL